MNARLHGSVLLAPTVLEEILAPLLERSHMLRFILKGTLRIRQGWFKLWSRVGGLGSVINGSYIITGKQQNLAFAA